MILVDSNVPMYLVGVDHPHKHDVQRLLDQAVSRRERLVSDAEVLREILHRYHAIGRPDALQPAFDALLGVVDEVFPVEQDDVEAAKAVLLGAYGLSARDAIHVAIMERYEVTRIMTFDRAFDRYPGIERLA